MSVELKAHFALPVTTIAHVVKMTRRDGFMLSVTPDHDQDITFDGVTYKSAFGVIPSAAESTAAMSVDTMDVRGALQALAVSEADVAAGLWDLCEVRVMRVNYKDLTMGCEKCRGLICLDTSIGGKSTI